MTKCTCEDAEIQLYEIIEEGDLVLAIKILMMEEYQNIDKFRAYKLRDRFLGEKGLEIIKKGLPATEYFWLMIASTKGSAELKYRLSSSLDLKTLASKMPLTIDSVHILLELATNGNYLEISEYLSKITSEFSIFSSEIITKVTQPHYLFNPISNSSRHSSTATSTFHIPERNLFEHGLKNCQIVSGSYILTLLIFLQRCLMELQLDILKKLLSLSCSYANKQILCSLQLSKLLLQIIPNLNISATETCYLIVKNLISYSISSEEGKILMENLSNPSIQNICSECLSLNLHSNFYVLQNQTLDTPTITSFSKFGYSLMFWVKFQQVTTDLTSIFSWVDHNRGLVLFKLSIMHTGEKKINGLDLKKGNESGSYLMIQAPTQPVFPAPDDTAKYFLDTNDD